MTYIEDKACDTAEEFIDYFRHHPQLTTRSEYTAHYPGIGGYIFRGQANAEWKLIPKAFRSDNPPCIFIGDVGASPLPSPRT